MTARDYAILRAVAVGRGQLVCGCEPDLLIDGCWCADQCAAHRLAREGLIAGQIPGTTGMRVLAILTDAGRRALAEVGVGAA
ncbi:MAG: hypothetical protein ACRDRZ_13130 [Pseudonocardiaceae bacterium]